MYSDPQDSGVSGDSDDSSPEAVKNDENARIKLNSTILAARGDFLFLSGEAIGTSTLIYKEKISRSPGEIGCWNDAERVMKSRIPHFKRKLPGAKRLNHQNEQL